MGFGNFSSFGETDMMLRNVNTCGVEVYDINNNQITGASFMGTVGLDWQVGGFGNFSSRGTSDMVLRNAKTGGLEVYDIDSNQITGAAFMGTVGLDWQIIGTGNFSSMPGETPDDAQHQDRRAGSLRHRQQPDHRGRFSGPGRIGLAGRRFRHIERIHGRLESGGATRAGDGELRRRRRGREHEYRCPRRRHVTAAVADGAATRVTAARRLTP